MKSLSSDAGHESIPGSLESPEAAASAAVIVPQHVLLLQVSSSELAFTVLELVCLAACSG